MTKKAKNPRRNKKYLREIKLSNSGAFGTLDKRCPVRYCLTRGSFLRAAVRHPVESEKYNFLERKFLGLILFLFYKEEKNSAPPRFFVRK